MEKDFEVLIAGFIKDRVGVSEHFLSVDLANHLKQNILTLIKQKLLLAAGTGNAEKIAHNSEIRSDSIYWLDRKHENKFENEFFEIYKFIFADSLGQADIFREDFSSATVVTLYLLEELNAKLRPLVLKMKPGTRVVSNNFSMGDWEPDQVIEWSGQTAYLWRVPALVHGHWTLTGLSQLPAEKEHTIYLEQRFQRLSGTLTTGGKTQALLGARIDGDILHFSFLNARGELQPVKALVQGDQWRGELVGPYGMVELAQPPAPISAKRNAP